jgi:hypothetical protein
MELTRQSRLTGRINTMELPVTMEQIEAYARGVRLIQDAFPTLTPGQREFIMTGITPEEWDAHFGEFPMD